MATGGEDGSLCLWDVTTGEELARKTRKEKGVVFRTPEFGFLPDGRSVVQLDGNDLVIWTSMATEPIRTIASFQNLVPSFSLCPDGRTVAMWGTGSVVSVRDLSTGKILRDLDAGGNVLAFAMAPDGATAAAASDARRICFWNLRTGEKLGRPISLKGCGFDLAYSPDGGRLLCSEFNAHQRWPSVTLWDVATRQALWTKVRADANRGPLVFSPDGRVLAGALDGVTLWDSATGKDVIPQVGHRAPVTTSIQSPDGLTLATGGSDGMVRLWDLASAQQRAVFEGAEATVRGLAFSPDGRLLGAVTADRGIVWEFGSGRIVFRFGGSPDGGANPLSSPLFNFITFLEEGRIAAGGPAGITVWEPPSATPAATLPACSVSGFARSPERGLFALGGMDHAIRLRANLLGRDLLVIEDERSKELGRRSMSGGKPSPSSFRLAWSPDGRRIASASGTYNDVRIWEVATGMEIVSLNTDYRLVELSITFSPDGRTVALQGFPDRLEVWDLLSGGRVFAAPSSEGADRNPDPGAWTLPRTGCAIYLHSGDALGSAEGNSVLIWDTKAAVKLETGWKRELHAWDWEYLWDDLAASDAAKAFRAVRAMASEQDRAASFLAGRLYPLPREDRRIREWIEELDHDDAAKRGNAMARIRALGSAAEHCLRDALSQGGPLERRQRLEELLADATGPRIRAPEELRIVRAIEVLERTATESSQALLRSLAERPDGRASREARSALGRIMASRR